MYAISCIAASYNLQYLALFIYSRNWAAIWAAKMKYVTENTTNWNKTNQSIISVYVLDY